MQDIYETFEFKRIKEEISQFSKTELGKYYIEHLVMFNNVKEVKQALNDLTEMSSLFLRYGPLPISNSANVLELINIAKKTALLTPRDLNLIAEDVKTIALISRYLSKIDSSYVKMNQYRNEFKDLSNLEKEIRRVITNSLTIYDNATTNLKEIRISLKKKEDALNSRSASIALKYTDYLNDGNVTIRDGHLVLPVKTIFKHKVMGILYDVSDSGATTFIEPLEIVELNNEITALKVSENEEIRKILKELTNLVLLQEEEVVANNKIIAELDFLQAKAMYMKEKEGCIASISDSPYIELKESAHPLIDKNKVVKNNYYLDNKKRLVIISGPNAGGKTVSLKTVGLLVLMNQCGLPLTSQSALLSYFNHIYIDIGDNQSLSDNLSTFSAHISQIGEITNLVTSHDLVLLDELGTGTDPKEGEALAIAVVTYLEKIKCLGMISSHFSKLKEYAFTSLSLENSSMVFDEDNLKPTYIFKLGAPGKSYALDVASRFNLNKDIILEARKIISSENNSESSLLIEELEKKVKENTFLEEKLKKQEENLKKMEIGLEMSKKALEKQKSTLLETVKSEKERLIDETKTKIDEILSIMTTNNLKMHEAIDLKHKLDELKEEKEEYYFNENIKENDYVSIPSLNIFGRVKRLNGKKAHILSDEGLSFDVDVNKLHIEEEVVNKVTKVFKNNIKYEDKINVSIGLELNIIGLRREEALFKLTKYLDECRLKNLKQVRIIHGFGNGILRNMTHEYLKKQKDLTYRLGDMYEGGGGATVINFK